MGDDVAGDGEGDARHLAWPSGLGGCRCGFVAGAGAPQRQADEDRHEQRRDKPPTAARCRDESLCHEMPFNEREPPPYVKLMMPELPHAVTSDAPEPRAIQVMM